MTLKELNNLRGIESEISMILKNIDELRTQAEHITPNITTYTHTNPKTGQKETCVLPNVGGAGSAHSRTEIFTELISEEEEILHQALTKRLTERRKLLIFIETIPDSQTRRIFRYRFVDLLSWGKVARNIGGGNTSDSVRMQVMRFLENQ